MKCRTSCIYCYADRKNPNAVNLLPIERIEEIIDEAKKLGTVKFKLMGGEVLMHKDWYRILKKLSENGYRPELSTKMSLNQKHIDAIKEFDIAPIQISLDTMIKDNLYKVLQVRDPYYSEIENTFKLLEKNQVKYCVHTVITKYNNTFQDIDSLENYFKDKKYLVDWAFDVAKCSMYLDYKYDKYKITPENFEKLRDYIQIIDEKNIFDFKIRLPFARKYKEFYSKSDLDLLYERRTPCSGNLFGIYILPDGKVTLCEELYWHPQFIIGDLSKESIMDVWNSQKALDLFYLKQDSIQEKSACKTCKTFSECRNYKHVCWRDIILGYGHENWDYPDLFCSEAPKITKDIFLYPTP
jgi:radical SAM protein with 4Fe4S-binding SPASM domain